MDWSSYNPVKSTLNSIGNLGGNLASGNFADASGDYMNIMSLGGQNAIKQGIHDASTGNLGNLDPTKVANVDTGGISGAAAGAQTPVNQFADYLGQAQGRKAPTVSAQQFNPTMAQAAGNVNAAQIGNGNTSQAMGMQQRAVDLAHSAALGNAPSAAALQLQQGQESALKQQMAAANSGRGGFNPGAVRNAQIQGASMQAAANQNAGILRAQEMAQARGQFGEMANAYTGQNVGMATSQAGLSQQAALANQGVTQQTNLANAGFTNTAGLANASNALQASGQNASNQVNMFAQMNNLQAQYMQGGLSASDARQKAATDIASLKAGQAATSAQLRGQIAGGILGGVGAAAGAAVGA